MKSIITIILLATFTLSSCKPSEAELRSELANIEGEMVAIRIAANEYQSRMNQAEFDSIVGSFATGFGATSGEYDLAGTGVQTVAGAMQDYNVSSYSLDQLVARYQQLDQRRNEILVDLD